MSECLGPAHATKKLETAPGSLAERRVVGLPKPSQFTALLLIGLSSLVSRTALADSPAWLSLVRPQQGFVTYTAGIGVAHTEHSYTEIWSRTESRCVEYSYGVQLYLCPVGTPHQALAFDTSVTQAVERSVLHTWTPQGPSSAVISRDTGLRPQLHVGWQYETLSPLWRRGLELGYAVYSAKNSEGRPDASVWLARAYEPVVLSMAVTYALHEATAAKVGAEVALTHRLALATDILWQWSSGSEGHYQPRVSMELAATLRQEDHTGWNMAIRLRPEAHSVTVERSLPLH